MSRVDECSALCDTRKRAPNVIKCVVGRTIGILSIMIGGAQYGYAEPRIPSLKVFTPAYPGHEAGQWNRTPSDAYKKKLACYEITTPTCTTEDGVTQPGKKELICGYGIVKPPAGFPKNESRDHPCNEYQGAPFTYIDTSAGTWGPNYTVGKVVQHPYGWIPPQSVINEVVATAGGWVPSLQCPCASCPEEKPVVGGDGKCQECPDGEMLPFPEIKPPHQQCVRICDPGDTKCEECVKFGGGAACKEKKKCTDPKLPNLWESDGQCHECPEGVYYCKCGTEPTVSGNEVINVGSVCKDGASSAAFKTAWKKKTVTSPGRTLVFQKRAHLAWHPQVYRGVTKDTNGWNYQKFTKMFNPTDSKGNVPVLFEHYLLVNDKRYYFKMFPSDRVRFGSCSESGDFLTFTFSDVPVYMEEAQCGKDQLRNITDLSKLKCTVTRTAKREANSGLSVVVELKTVTRAATSIKVLGALDGMQYDVNSATITLGSGVDNFMAEASNLIVASMMRETTTFDVAKNTYNVVRRTNHLKKAVAVQKDVIAALSNIRNYPPGGVKKTTKMPAFGLPTLVKIMTSGAEGGTWGSEGSEETALTWPYEAKLMKTLEYLANDPQCKKITNGDFARAAIKVTEGDLALTFFLMRNASVNISAGLRDFVNPASEVFEYRRNLLPGTERGGNFTYYAPATLAKVGKKLSLMEDYPIQRLDDPMGPWYHFYGALFATTHKAGFLGTELEILLFDDGGIKGSRNPNALQNASGRLGYKKGFSDVQKALGVK